MILSCQVTDTGSSSPILSLLLSSQFPNSIEITYRDPCPCSDCKLQQIRYFCWTLRYKSSTAEGKGDYNQRTKCNVARYETEFQGKTSRCIPYQ
uniref:Uncharacterized protein n=1 Tax=Arundo donax TaxID=35708 RepID=A0A0A9B6Z1_ARUDO